MKRLSDQPQADEAASPMLSPMAGGCRAGKLMETLHWRQTGIANTLRTRGIDDVREDRRLSPAIPASTSPSTRVGAQ
jgi:hypothetical protein